MPWMRRWRDWGMPELWSAQPLGPETAALNYRYEKAGLLVENEPIPWNAEAVLVEGRVRLPPAPERHKADFMLRLGSTIAPQRPEQMRKDEQDGSHRVLFRLKPPDRATTVELIWRTRSLAQMTLPVLAEEDFKKNLTLQMPSLQVRLDSRTVPCRTYVSTQCDGLVAAAVLTSPTSLVPIQDLDLHLDFRFDRGGMIQSLPIQLSSSQLTSRQALVTVVPRKPRRLGPWQATWKLGHLNLATRRIKAITARQFQHSLQISATRFVIQDGKGQITLSRMLPPLDGMARLGPCFCLTSSEQEMAGICALQARAQINGVAQGPILAEEEVLITDGPCPFVPGTLALSELEDVTGFELRLKGRLLGVLPLTRAPEASFSSEGGFRPAADFVWSPAADDELGERLGRLLDSR